MKKRLATILAGVLVIGALLAPGAFAQSDNNQAPQVTSPPAPFTQQGDSNYRNFYNWMFDWHKAWADNAEKNGQITSEQAQAWKQHFDYMKDFHYRYGMGMMGGGMMGGVGNGLKGGYGPGGMMGGFGYGGVGGYTPGWMMGGFGNGSVQGSVYGPGW